MSISLTIEKTIPAEAPMALLLLADPFEAKVRSYLDVSECFVARLGTKIVGVCSLIQRRPQVYELMNIAIDSDDQQHGYGSALLKWVIAYYREKGARQLEVGTGSFGYQLTFYQRYGFRVTSIERDFFVSNYPEPIIEEGIQLRDMLRLTLLLIGSSAPNA